MKADGYGGVKWPIAALLLFVLVILLLGLVFCQPPATTVPATRTSTPTATPTRTVTRTPVPPTVKPPTRTPRPEDFYTGVAEPKDMLFWRGVLWVVSRRGTLHVIDPRDMKIVYSRGLDLKEAWGIAVTEFNGKSRLAITGENAVTVVDANQLLVMGTLRLEGRAGRPAALGRYLFVPIHDKWSVAVIDLFYNPAEMPLEPLMRTIKTEAGPFAAAANQVTGEVLVTHRDAPKIAVLDGVTGEVRRLVTITDPEDPTNPAKSLYSLAVAPDGRVYVAYARASAADRPNRLVIFSPDLSQSTTHPLCDLGEGGQMVFDDRPGGPLYAACHGGTTIWAIPRDGTEGSYAVYEVGQGPFGLAFDQKGNHLFVGLKGENKVKKVW